MPLVGRHAYRVGFQQPWTERAENQGFMSMQIAARHCGHRLIAVNTTSDILAADLDFVLCVASLQAKTTHLPTFANIHEPRVRWWETEAHFHNLLTYDGYLTISDTLHDFLKAFAAGFGRRQEIGFYFNTPQRQRIRAKVAQLARRDRIRLCYFGTNWEPRTRPVFRALSARPYMRIYGPDYAWEYLNGQGYCGSLPFDGYSVQITYAQYGAGLVSLSKNHLLDDIVSNRIFEISSVGAVSICPDIPWIRRNFGEAVYYYNPHQRYSEVAAEIDAAMDEIRTRPDDAAERAHTAAEIFEKKFAAEVLFPNVIEYYENWLDERERVVRARRDEPTIDVIIRVGGRSVEKFVRRAVRSVEDQAAGRFRLVFVRWKEIDLSPITDAAWSRIESFSIVDCPGGGRSATMTAGLRAVESRYFCLLDDDDFWLQDHIASLLEKLAKLPPGRGLAYSGVLNQRPLAEGEDPAKVETRHIVSLSPAAAGRVHGRPTEGTVWDVTGSFAPNGWLADSELLDGLVLDDWHLKTAEDTVVVAHMLARAEVAFTWRATAVQVLGSEGASNFQGTNTRLSDLLECMLRIGPGLEIIERRFAAPRATVWERLGGQVQELFRQKGEATRPSGSVLVLQEGVVGTSIHERDAADRREVPLVRGRIELHGRSRVVDGEDGGTAVEVLPPPEKWNYGLVVPLGPEDLLPGRQFAVLEFDRLSDSFGVGVLDHSGTEFMSRIEAPSVDVPVELWLPIDDPAAAKAVIVQNWDRPSEIPAVLRKIWFVGSEA